MKRIPATGLKRDAIAICAKKSGVETKRIPATGLKLEFDVLVLNRSLVETKLLSIEFTMRGDPIATAVYYILRL